MQLMKSAIACLTDDHHVEPASSVPALAVAETPLPHAGRFRTATSRDHSINARLLHERLNHPSHDRLLKWSKIALGFPSPNDPSTKKLIESAACHDRTCDTCHVAKDKRTGVPSSSRVGRSHRPGMTWSVDFTRTFPASTPEGSTTALVAMERATHYIKIYLLSSHTDFWDAAQQLVDWCASHVGTEIRELQGDCDVIWSTGPLHQPTVQCIDFCTHNQINFSKSPPYTQNLNRVEGAMEALLGGMYASMVHAHVGASMWGDALLHQAMVMNMGPIPGKSIPKDILNHKPIDPLADPRLEFSPQGALLGTLPDISLLTVPLFATAWVLSPNSKASQLQPKSRIGVYVGVADGTLGFKVRLVSDLTCVSSLHVRFDPDLTNRPLALARRHDLLSGQGGCDASTSLPDALSKLFEDPLAGDDGTIVVFDTFTNLPVKLFPSANTDYGTSLVELHCTESPDQPIFGRRVRSEIPGADPRDGTIREVTSVDGVRNCVTWSKAACGIKFCKT